MTNAERIRKCRNRKIKEGFCQECLVRPAAKGIKNCIKCKEHRKQVMALKNFLDACVVYAIDIAGFRYIGSTHNWEKRKKEWRSSLKHNLSINPRLQTLYNQHGKDALTFTVLATLSKDTTKLARRAIEQTYIDDTSPEILLNEYCACRGCRTN